MSWICWFFFIGQLGTPEPSIYQTAAVHADNHAEASVRFTIIDRAAIEASGATNLLEILRLAPGLSLLEQGSGFATVSIRGGDANFTKVMIDGIGVNILASQVGGVFNVANLSASSIERIEMVPGPLSAFYGSTGLGGVIHIITRAENRKAGFSTLLSGGSNAYADGQVRCISGNGLNQFDLGFTQRESEVGQESFEQWRLGSQGKMPLAFAEMAYAARIETFDQSDYPDASGGPLWGDGQTRNSEHQELGFAASIDLDSRRQHQFQFTAFQHEYKRQSPAIANQVPATFEDVRYRELALRWQAKLKKMALGTININADLSYQDTQNKSILNIGFPVPGGYQDDRSLIGTHLYWHGRQKQSVWDVGLRFDYADGKDAWSPRFSYHQQMGNAWVFHGSLGKAFKLPDFFALASPQALGGNPALKPETVWSGDLGLRGDFARTSLGLTLFHNRFKNLIDFDFESFSHLNRSEVRVIGTEAYATWRWQELQGGINLTWQQASIKGSAKPFYHRPRLKGTSFLNWTPNRSWLIRFDVSYKSRILDQQIPVPQLSVVGSHTLLGTTLKKQLTPKISLKLRMNNLMDKNYETLIGFPGYGRNGTLAISIEPF